MSVDIVNITVLPDSITADADTFNDWATTYTTCTHDNNRAANVLVSFNYLVRLDYGIYSLTLECRHHDSVKTKII